MASAIPQLNLRLWFGDVLVADLLNAFPHQGTWFAQYRQVVAPEQGALEARLCEFIRLCEEWHQRLDRGEEPDAREFDRYGELIEVPPWRVECPGGTELGVGCAPGFAQGDASWNHPEAGPSRELAAGQIWARLTGASWPP